jgi:hypothetical protein
MTNENETLGKAFKDLTAELNRLRRNNLKLRLYMEILASTPRCKTAEKIRDTYGEKIFSESLIHLN